MFLNNIILYIFLFFFFAQAMPNDSSKGANDGKRTRYALN